MKIKQIYHNYNLWEDYKNGMWRKLSKEEDEDILPDIVDFMKNSDKFGEAMMNVVKEWIYTCEHNLTDNAIYHKPFIGQCAVCYELKAPEYLTRLAWNKLTNEEQINANKKAALAIKYWKKQQLKKTINYVNKELFK